MASRMVEAIFAMRGSRSRNLSSLFPVVQSSLNARPEGFDRLRLADEEIFGELPVSQDLGVNRAALVEIEAEPGEILEAKIAVAVDVRVFEPLLQVDRPTRVSREHVHRRAEADV